VDTVRVLNPGPGELCDRLTVLELKLENGRARCVDVSAWEEEKKEIGDELEGKFNVTDDKEAPTFDLVTKLRALNKLIWEGIDKQHDFAKRNPHLSDVDDASIREIAQVGITVMEWNDARARLIGELNALYGIKRPEKVIA
jgi:hypothetical protein